MLRLGVKSTQQLIHLEVGVISIIFWRFSRVRAASAQGWLRAGKAGSGAGRIWAVREETSCSRLGLGGRKEGARRGEEVGVKDEAGKGEGVRPGEEVLGVFSIMFIMGSILFSSNLCCLQGDSTTPPDLGTRLIQVLAVACLFSPARLFVTLLFDSFNFRNLCSFS